MRVNNKIKVIKFRQFRTALGLDASHGAHNWILSLSFGDCYRIHLYMLYAAIHEGEHKPPKFYHFFAPCYTVSLSITVIFRIKDDNLFHLLHVSAETALVMAVIQACSLEKGLNDRGTHKIEPSLLHIFGYAHSSRGHCPIKRMAMDLLAQTIIRGSYGQI